MKMEFLIQKGVGYHTPQTLLYAVDYFSKVFGFDPTGNAWFRAKRLALRYAKSKPGLANRAPAITKETLGALEVVVLDPSYPMPERIAAGKWRLCCQASIRYDDLVHTPLKNLQWVTRKGEEGVVGVRARTTQGKCKARPWVASLMGIDPKHDQWLVTLMALLAESHGSAWQLDDPTTPVRKSPEMEPALPPNRPALASTSTR